MNNARRCGGGEGGLKRAHNSPAQSVDHTLAYEGGFRFYIYFSIQSRKVFLKGPIRMGTWEVGILFSKSFAM